MPEMMNNLPLEAVKICENTYRIEDNFVRCLLFVGRERALLVDTGFGGKESLKALVETLTNKPIQLVITHADPDHIGAAGEFDTVYMHGDEVPRYTGMTGEGGPKICTLQDGEIIDIGGRRFEALLVPGHTHGSVALLDRANRILIPGDLVSEMPIFLFGEDRDFDAYMASLEKLLALRDTFDEIYPSHGALPLAPAQIEKLLAAAKKFRAGELLPMEPPFPMPAKMYADDGAGFYI